MAFVILFYVVIFFLLRSVVFLLIWFRDFVVVYKQCFEYLKLNTIMK